MRFNEMKMTRVSLPRRARDRHKESRAKGEAFPAQLTEEGLSATKLSTEAYVSV